ncbi:MAG: autotransporter outer membrane beta-barrel domain-containing protein, partial [Verrucomicrobiota bacterium]
TIGGLTTGIAASYVGTEADLVAGGELEVDGVRAMFYAGYAEGPAHVSIVAGVGYHEFDSERSALVGSASGETEGVSFDGLVEGGYDFDFGKLTAGPLISLGYAGAEIHGFRETGSLAPLLVKRDYEDSLRSRVGFRVGGDGEMGGFAVSGELRAQWQHEYLDDNRSVGAFFANGAGGPFTVFGPSLGKDSVILGAGMSAEFSETVSGYLNYEAEFGRANSDRHTIQLGVQIAY